MRACKSKLCFVAELLKINTTKSLHVSFFIRIFAGETKTIRNEKSINRMLAVCHNGESASV